MKRLLYICSLPHSGSTVLSLFLGTHSRLVGLGGIDRAVQVLGDALASGAKKVGKLFCTCGEAATECRYWGAVSRRMNGTAPAARSARYHVALDTFHEVFGPDFVPVDSSKHVEPLADLRQIKDLDLKVVHVIKDVRTLTTSFIDHARKNKKTRAGWLLAMEYFWRWRRENGKIDAAVERHHIPRLRVGYEEVCLMPSVIMAAISEFAGVPSEPGSIELRHSQSHLIVGNRMRAQEEKQVLRYDPRWMMRRDWIIASVLFPQIRRYNSTAVYSNNIAAMWSQ